MIRKLVWFAFWLLLLFALPALGQVTTPTAVTGIIVDPNGVPYYPATVTPCLFPVTNDPVVDGVHVNPIQGGNYCQPPANTTATGAFNLSLFPNNNIQPGPTQWQFIITTVGTSPPAGKGQVSFFVNLTISAGTQDVGGTLSASAPVLLNSGGGSGTGSGSGTPATVSCWSGSSTPTLVLGNCGDITDNGNVAINGPLNITATTGPFGMSVQEGTPAACLPPAAGQQILCSINSPDSLVLSSNGGAYAPIGLPPGAGAGTLQYKTGGGVFGGITNWTTNGTTNLTASAGAGLDLSSMDPNGLGGGGFLLPRAAGAHPTSLGMFGINTTNGCLVYGLGSSTNTICTSGATGFNVLTSATNTTAAMVCGTGCSLGPTGAGTINATAIGGITVTGTPLSGYVPTATSGSAATWQAQAGGGSGAWSGISGSATNTNTGFILAPTATGTVPWTNNCPSGITVDCFDIELNGVKQWWIDSTGDMNLLGTNFNLGSSTSPTAGFFGCHGGNTSSLPCSISLYNNADTIQATLAASGTNARLMMTQGPATAEIVANFLEEAPTTNPQTVTSYAINANIVNGAIDYGRTVTRTNAGAMSDTIAAAGAGTGLLDEFHFGNGWHTEVQVLPGSVGSDTITATTSNFVGCDSSPAHTVVIAPGNSISIISDGTNYQCQRNAGSGSYTFTSAGGHINTQAATTDISGTIAISSATSAAKTFSTAYANAPNCTITPTSDPTSVGTWWVSTSTTAVTANVHTSGTITFMYHCIAATN